MWIFTVTAVSSHYDVCRIMGFVASWGLSPITGFVANSWVCRQVCRIMWFIASYGVCRTWDLMQYRIYSTVAPHIYSRRINVRRLCPGTAFRNCAPLLSHWDSIFILFLSSFYNISNQLFLHFNTLINKSELFLFRRWVGLAVSVPASRPPVPGKNLGPGGGLPTVWSEVEQICTVIM